MASDAFRALGRIPTSTIYEANGRSGNMHREIKPLVPGMRVAGPAFTVSCAPSDNLALHRALTEAPVGTVIVVSTSGATNNSYAGAIIVAAARRRGAAGLIIDGLVRDVDEIRAMNLPVFSRGAGQASGNKEVSGDIQVTVECGGVPVSAGDAIIGDGDGVVCVSSRETEAVLRRALEREERERYIMAGLAAGRTTMQLLGLDKRS